MHSARFMVIKVTLHDRPDGGLRVSSADLPGLILSGADRKSVFEKIAPTIRALLERRGLKPLNVECAITVEEALKRTPPCQIDMHVQSHADATGEEDFVVELLAA